MDWVHCNNCGTRPNQIKMFLTMCGHVFCQNCVAKAKSTQICYVCKKPLKAGEIGKNMRLEYMEFFKDLRQLAGESMMELKNILNFQTKQREFYWKIKHSQTKKESEQFNEARQKQAKAMEEFQKQKMEFSEDDKRLKEEKEKKKQLTEKLHSLHKKFSQQKRKFPPPSSTSSSTPPPSSSLRPFTEPPTSKNARFVAPNVPRKGSLETASQHDQSTSKIVTSTPIANIHNARRDFMNRMFTAGDEHPSPIPKI